MICYLYGGVFLLVLVYQILKTAFYLLLPLSYAGCVIPDNFWLTPLQHAPHSATAGRSPGPADGSPYPPEAVSILVHFRTYQFAVEFKEEAEFVTLGGTLCIILHCTQ